MATLNPGSPSDGWYWFQSEDPRTEDRVVHIVAGNIEFPGTDYVALYGEKGTTGIYAPVAPAPWGSKRNIIYDGDRWECVTDGRAKKLVKAGAITHCCNGSCVVKGRAGARLGDTVFHLITTWKHVEEVQ